MVKHEDKSKLILIDFEYTMLNFRGFDIAASINETYMDYTCGHKPFFKFYDDKLVYKFERGEEVERCLIIYLCHYYNNYLVNKE
jgi:thiamine kinase-like enzyme